MEKEKWGLYELIFKDEQEYFRRNLTDEELVNEYGVEDAADYHQFRENKEREIKSENLLQKLYAEMEAKKNTAMHEPQTSFHINHTDNTTMDGSSQAAEPTDVQNIEDKLFPFDESVTIITNDEAAEAAKPFDDSADVHDANATANDNDGKPYSPAESTSTVTTANVDASATDNTPADETVKEVNVGVDSARGVEDRQRIQSLIERGDVTVDELTEFKPFVKSVKELLPVPNTYSQHVHLKGALYYVLEYGCQGTVEEKVIRNVEEICAKLKITPTVEHISTDEKKKPNGVVKRIRNYRWEITPTDFLKIVVYVADHYATRAKTHKASTSSTSTSFTGESLNYGADILTPSNESIKDELSAVNAMDYDGQKALRRKINLLNFRRVLMTDRKGDGYICPICGNGSGESGDGITPYEGKNGNAINHCFKCGFSGNNIGLISKVTGLEWKSPKVLAIGLRLFSLAEKNQSVNGELPPVEKIVKEKTQAELALIAADIAESQKHLEELPEVDRRGLSLEILRHFGVGYSSNWIHPVNRLKNENLYPSRRLIIPTSERHYLAALLKSDRASVKKDYWKQHAGNIEMFNANAVVPNQTVIVVEGEIDAMSLWQVTNGEVNVAAVGGTSGYSRLSSFLKAKKLSDADKLNYFFVVCLDNDEAGHKAANDFVGKLIIAGYPAIAAFLSDGDIKVDANDILVKEGDAALADRVQKIIEDAESKLEQIKEDVAEKRKLAQQKAPAPAQVDKTVKREVPAQFKLTAEQRDFLFAGDTTDLDFARRIWFMNENRIRYLQDVDKFILFDGVKWNMPQNIGNGILFPAVTELADVLDANADNANKHERQIATSLKSGKKCAAAITMIKGISPAIVTADDLNNHPNLLNCQNGVVDLQTGKLYQHDARLLMTQCINAAYRAGYHSDVTEKFLNEIITDEETLAAVTRYLGYCLTGEVNAEKAMLWYGRGGNGKGTLTNTLIRLFGSYATPFPVKTILARYQSKDADAATPAFSKLKWKRLAISEEIPQSERLDAATFKLLTGGDAIPIRKLHEEASEISPTHKLLISGNYNIELDSSDVGLRRRIMRVEFNQTFTDSKQDTALKKKLVTADALTGLLTLLVDNAVSYYRDGLLESAEMSTAKEELFTENDYIGDFIASTVTITHDPHKFIYSSVLLKHLRDFAPRETSVISDNALRRQLKTALEDKGVKFERKMKGFAFVGVDWTPNYSDIENEDDSVDDF